MTPSRRSRNRVCGIVLPAWYAVPGEPDGVLLCHHLGHAHPADVGRAPAPMHTTDDITPVIVQASTPAEAEQHAYATKHDGPWHEPTTSQTP